jgi:hypothetical protein
MILQLAQGNSDEGMFIWIIVITVLATIGIAILRSIVGSVVEYFLIKKDENKENAKKEVRRFSMVAFIFIIGILLLIFQDSLALFINRPVEEVSFAGFLTIIFAILIAGLTYRNTLGRIKRV